MHLQTRSFPSQKLCDTTCVSDRFRYLWKLAVTVSLFESGSKKTTSPMPIIKLPKLLFPKSCFKDLVSTSLGAKICAICSSGVRSLLLQFCLLSMTQQSVFHFIIASLSIFLSQVFKRILIAGLSGPKLIFL